MITEKQIKARFNKNHLRALVRKMLKQEFYDYHNRKRDEQPTPLYTLRYGVTPELIADNVRFGEIWNSDTNAFAKLYGEWNYVNRRTGEGLWQKCECLRMRRIADGQYEILGNYKTESDAEKVDLWIESHLLDHDQWVKNNSAIDIFF